MPIAIGVTCLPASFLARRENYVIHDIEWAVLDLCSSYQLINNKSAQILAIFMNIIANVATILFRDIIQILCVVIMPFVCIESLFLIWFQVLLTDLLLTSNIGKCHLKPSMFPVVPRSGSFMNVFS